MAIANITNNILTDSGIATSSLVPYTGATTNVDLGFFNFDANQINGFKIVAKLDGTSSGSLILRTGTSGYSYGGDSISLISSPTSANTLTIVSDVSSVTKIAQISLGSLTATRTFTLPDTSGTLALTSNLSAYLPLSGGTLTGALNGTSAAFSSFVNAFSFTAIGGTSNAGQISLKHTGAISVGDGYVTIAADSSNTLGIYFFNSFSAKFSISALTNNRTYTLPDGTGTLALTSNLSAYLPLTGGTLTGALSGTSATFVASGTYTNFLIGTTSTTGAIIADANRSNLVLGAATSNKIVFNNASTTQNGYIYSDSAELSLGYPASGTFNIQKVGVGNVLSIASTGAATFSSSVTALGNVLIGTSTAPSAIGVNDLLVIGKSGSASNAINFSNGSTTNWGYILAESGKMVFGSGSSSNITFETNAGSERMRITSGGNVGIGVVPSAWGGPFNALQLGTFGQHFAGQTNAADLKIGTNNFYNGSGYVYTTSLSGATQLNMSSNNGYDFNIAPVGTAGNAITFTTAMRITSGGYVGINTSSPRGILNTKNGAGELVFSQTNGRDIEAIVNGSRGNLDLLCNNLYISNLGTGTVYSNGGVLTNTNPSDENLKENVADLTFGLNEIMQLRPVSYDWKNNVANQSTQYGFIAQEVQKVLPQLVTEFDSFEDKEREIATKRLGLDKDAIFVSLVKAIQEQQAQIEELKALINK